MSILLSVLINSAAASSNPVVLITEIMYDPASPERKGRLGGPAYLGAHAGTCGRAAAVALAAAGYCAWDPAGPLRAPRALSADAFICLSFD